MSSSSNWVALRGLGQLGREPAQIRWPGAFSRDGAPHPWPLCGAIEPAFDRQEVGNALSWGLVADTPNSFVWEIGHTAQHWGVLSDCGGKAEILGQTNASQCTGYGGPFCIYPWFSSTANGTWHYGIDYPDTVADYGRADRFAQALDCDRLFGPNSTYCDNVVK
jgi:hypothetical protein